MDEFLKNILRLQNYLLSNADTEKNAFSHYFCRLKELLEIPSLFYLQCPPSNLPNDFILIESASKQQVVLTGEQELKNQFKKKIKSENATIFQLLLENESVNFKSKVIYAFLIGRNQGRTYFLLLPSCPILENAENCTILLDCFSAIFPAFYEIYDTENSNGSSKNNNDSYYQDLVENSPDCILHLDLEGKIINASNNIGLELGYTLEELKRMNYSDDLLHPSEKTAYQEFRDFYSQNGIFKEEIFERKWRHKEGHYLNFQNSLTNLHNPDGELTGLLVISRNITEYKLKQGELDFQVNLLKNIQDSIIVLDLNGKIIYFNQGAEKIFGYTADEIIGKTPELLYPQELKENFEIDINEILQGRDYKGEWMGLHKSGKNIWLNILTTLLKTEDGKILGIVGVAKDITERKKMEFLLEETTEIAQVGGWEYDLLEHKLYFTNQVYRILEPPLDSEITIGKFISFFDKNFQSIFKNAFKTLSEFGYPFNLELKIQTGKGDYKWVRVKGSKEQQQFLNHKAYGTIQDITIRKLAFEELSQTKKFLSKITENAPFIIYVFNLNTFSNDYSNIEIFHILGYTTDEVKELASQFITIILHPEDTEMVLQHWRGLFQLKDNTLSKIQYRAKKKNGNYIWLESTETVFEKDENGFVSKILGFAEDITERKKAEEELQNREARIRSIINNSDALIFSIDRNYSITAYNENMAVAYKQYFGVEKVLGESIFQFIQDDLKEKIKHEYDLVFQGERRKFYYQSHYGGRENHHESFYNPIFDESKEVVGLTVYTHTISERIEQEKKILESEAILRAMFEGSVESAYLLDKNYIILQASNKANEAVKKYSGREIELGESSFLTLFDEPIENKQDFVNNFQKCFEGEFQRFEKKIKLPHISRELWFQITYQPVYIQEKRVNAVVLSLLDITEKKNVELKIQKAYQEVKNFRNALISSTMIVITDKNGIITYVNKAFCKSSKYQPRELIGMGMRILNANHHSTDFFLNMVDTITSGKYWKGEVKNKAKDGSYFWMDMVINPVFNEKGEIYEYLTVNYDISERKRIEEQKENLIKNLSDFAFVTSHNLRRPLANILGLISLFDKNNMNDPFNLEIIDKLQLASKSLDEVIFEMNRLLEEKD